MKIFVSPNVRVVPADSSFLVRAQAAAVMGQPQLQPCVKTV